MSPPPPPHQGLVAGLLPACLLPEARTCDCRPRGGWRGPQPARPSPPTTPGTRAANAVSRAGRHLTSARPGPARPTGPLWASHWAQRPAVPLRWAQGPLGQHQSPVLRGGPVGMAASPLLCFCFLLGLAQLSSRWEWLIPGGTAQPSLEEAETVPSLPGSRQAERSQPPGLLPWRGGQAAVSKQALRGHCPSPEEQHRGHGGPGAHGPVHALQTLCL